MSPRVKQIADEAYADESVSDSALVLEAPPTGQQARIVVVGPDSAFEESSSVVESKATFLAAKRILDVVFSLIAIVFLIPVFAAVGIAIAVSSRGPVLFRQQRVGLNNATFTLYKFRSMYVDKQDVTGVAHTVKDDPRVTPVGWFIRRTYVDELPQLFNVLLGDMSVIGPRAQVAGMRIAGVSYEDLVPNYRWRHAARPGITGLAQVRGFRGEIKDAAHAIARVNSDLEYVRAATHWLDLKIMLLTIPSVILGKCRVSTRARNRSALKSVKNEAQAPG